MKEVESICPQWRGNVGQVEANRDVHEEIEFLLEQKDDDRTNASMKLGPSVSTMRGQREDEVSVVRNTITCSDAYTTACRMSLTILMYSTSTGEGGKMN